MRSSYLVSHDIADEKRVRFKLMRDFGDHLQFSVFERFESATRSQPLAERSEKHETRPLVQRLFPR
jgi:CRISPR/Cas system-associated endoribonuclease Cas2